MLVGRLSTKLSSIAWVSESIQCRSSNTQDQRLDLTLSKQQPLDARQESAGGVGKDRVPATVGHQQAHLKVRGRPAAWTPEIYPR